jgi:hypothetical protein
VLDSAPPKDGSALLAGDGVRADRLYVPQSWLSDPKAKSFLEQGLLIKMQPMAAEAGPFEVDETGSSAALSIPAGGGTLVFVPYASVKDFSQVSAKLSVADAVAMNVPASRDEKLLAGAALKCAILPGRVEGLGCTLYNSTACGSIEIGEKNGALSLSPWREEWVDGIQGNFR